MQLDFPALPNAANPAFVTHGNVAVVAPQQQLLALGNNVALPVYAGVDRSLGSTVADGFNLQNGSATSIKRRLPAKMALKSVRKPKHITGRL